MALPVVTNPATSVVQRESMVKSFKQALAPTAASNKIDTKLMDDAVLALTGLGFKKKEAEALVAMGLQSKPKNIQELITAALKAKNAPAPIAATPVSKKTQTVVPVKPTIKPAAPQIAPAAAPPIAPPVAPASVSEPTLNLPQTPKQKKEQAINQRFFKIEQRQEAHLKKIEYYLKHIDDRFTRTDLKDDIAHDRAAGTNKEVNGSLIKLMRALTQSKLSQTVASGIKSDPLFGGVLDLLTLFGGAWALKKVGSGVGKLARGSGKLVKNPFKGVTSNIKPPVVPKTSVPRTKMPMAPKGKIGGIFKGIGALGTLGLGAAMLSPKTPTTTPTEAPKTKTPGATKVPGATIGKKVGGGLLKALGPVGNILYLWSIWSELEDLYSKYEGKPKDEDFKKQFAKIIGKGAGGLALGALGGAVGAMAGSAVPGVGTVIGGLVGSIAGGLGGTFAGEDIGEWLGELIYEYSWGDPHKANKKILKTAHPMILAAKYNPLSPLNTPELFGYPFRESNVDKWYDDKFIKGFLGQKASGADLGLPPTQSGPSIQAPSPGAAPSMVKPAKSSALSTPNMVESPSVSAKSGISKYLSSSQDQLEQARRMPSATGPVIAPNTQNIVTNNSTTTVMNPYLSPRNLEGTFQKIQDQNWR